MMTDRIVLCYLAITSGDSSSKIRWGGKKKLPVEVCPPPVRTIFRFAPESERENQRKKG